MKFLKEGFDVFMLLPLNSQRDTFVFGSPLIKIISFSHGNGMDTPVTSCLLDEGRFSREPKRWRYQEWALAFGSSRDG